MSGIVGSRLNIRGSGLVGGLGTDGQVLTSAGAGQEIVFEAVSGAVTALNNATQSELVTVGSTTTELDAEANLTFTGSALTCIGTITVGVNDTGHDVKYFGATSGSYWLWDESADGVVQIGTLTVGVDDAGHDVKFFGDTASAFMLWDASTDDLVLGGAAKLYLYDAAGGENISSDGTDLTIASGAKINLTATSDVVIPADVGITFGTGEKIEGDNTDLTITSGAKINLTATSDVHIPNDVGIVFGGASEKIEGDGTDLTISANNLTVDAAADINLDAGGNNLTFKSGGTSILDISNSSSDAVITSSVQDKDIIFKGDDGGAAITALTLDMSDAGKATFNNDVVAFSDERLKSDIKTIENGLDKVLKMRGVTFKRDGVAGTGVIAQEIQDIFPEVVSSSQEYLAVAYGNMVGVLIEAIKDLQGQLDKIREG